MDAPGRLSRDETNRLLAATVVDLGVVKKLWAEHADPIGGLRVECENVVSDAVLADDLERYIRESRVIAESVGSALAMLAASAGAKLEDIAPVLRPLAVHGLKIGRWLPTFLVIDGPLGRFLTHADSPLCRLLRERWADFPLLAAARDTFNNDLFRRVRNGFAHWSFWIEEPSGRIWIANGDTGRADDSMTWLQVEALHFLAAQIVETLDQGIIRAVRARR
jgi:hypothetical protein